MKKIGILDPDGLELNPLNNKQYSEQYKILSEKWSKLPAYQHAEKIISLIANNNVVLIISSTGSGKTVLLPKFALHTLNYNGHIVVTMPKQMIVKSAADYASATLDVEMGKEIGYQYRGDSKLSKDTKILYATDGTLVAQLMKDPLIKMYDIVIIDEAHERKIQIDLLLFLLKNALKQRPDLKLIIMSATINESIFSNYFSEFKYASFDVQGERIFPINSIFTETQVSENNYLEVGYNIIKNITKTDNLSTGGSHDILFFVPSVSDTLKICNMVEKDNLDLYCVRVYSGIRKEEQFIAQDKNKYKEFGKNRKLVMATNVAESSITIDGIKFVIDSGFEFLSSYDPILRARKLDKSMITLAQAKQRMGRAGRTEPGTCYHLYTKQQFDAHMEKFPKPSIKTSNLFGDCVRLLCLENVGNISVLRNMLKLFIEPPLPEYVNSAITQMKELELIDSSGTPTNMCHVVNDIGMEPNMGISLAAGYYNKCYREVLCVSILLELCHGKIMDIFTKPDIDADKRIKEKFEDAFKYFMDSSGDHISILKIIHKYFKLYTKKDNNINDRMKWCYKYFLNYEILNDSFNTYKRLNYRVGDILRNNSNILKLDDNLLTKSTSKRVLASFTYGFRNHMAIKEKKMYTVSHCDTQFNISNDSFISTPPKKIIYYEIFISGDKNNLNIISKI